MENTKSLSADQLYNIANSLRTAAARYSEFSELAMQPPSNIRLKEQFDKQSREALEFASLLESAEFAHVVIPEEVCDPF